MCAGMYFAEVLQMNNCTCFLTAKYIFLLFDIRLIIIIIIIIMEFSAKITYLVTHKALIFCYLVTL